MGDGMVCKWDGLYWLAHLTRFMAYQVLTSGRLQDLIE